MNFAFSFYLFVFFKLKKKAIGSSRQKCVVAAWGGGGRAASPCGMGTGFRSHEMKRVVEMEGGDGRTQRGCVKYPELYT